jgi:hypothetical protein
VTVFGFIAAKRTEHSVKTLCRVLEVSRSGFHAWAKRAPSPRALSDARLTERIRQIHAEHRQVYGDRLREAGLDASRARFRPDWRGAGIVARHPR